MRIDKRRRAKWNRNIDVNYKNEDEPHKRYHCSRIRTRVHRIHRAKEKCHLQQNGYSSLRWSITRTHRMNDKLFAFFLIKTRQKIHHFSFVKIDGFDASPIDVAAHFSCATTHVPLAATSVSYWQSHESRLFVLFSFVFSFDVFLFRLKFNNKNVNIWGIWVVRTRAKKWKRHIWFFRRHFLWNSKTRLNFRWKWKRRKQFNLEQFLMNNVAAFHSSRSFLLFPFMRFFSFCLSISLSMENKPKRKRKIRVLISRIIWTFCDPRRERVAPTPHLQAHIQCETRPNWRRRRRQRCTCLRIHNEIESNPIHRNDSVFVSVVLSISPFFFFSFCACCDSIRRRQASWMEFVSSRI